MNALEVARLVRRFRKTGYVTHSQAWDLAMLALAKPGEECPACEGTGKNSEFNHDPPRNCSACGGTGKVGEDE